MTNHPFKPVLLDLLRYAQVSQYTFVQELSLTEQTAIGTPALWAAKDHVAHMTFWRQRLVLVLQAFLRREPLPGSDNFEKLNPLIFERFREQPWSAILAESDQAYVDLIALAEQLSEEDLMATFLRSDVTDEKEPLYLSFMGNCYEHTQNHLAQYAADRGDLECALSIYDTWAQRILEADVPDLLRGHVLYNLACFYATHGQVEKASAPLHQSFAFFPDGRELALTDPDLIALRSQQPD